MPWQFVILTMCLFIGSVPLADVVPLRDQEFIPRVQALEFPLRFNRLPLVADGFFFSITRPPLRAHFRMMLPDAGVPEPDNPGSMRLADIVARARQRPIVKPLMIGPRDYLLVQREGIGYEVIEVERAALQNETQLHDRVKTRIDIYSRGLTFNGNIRLTLGDDQYPMFRTAPENPLFFEGRALSMPISEFRAWPLTAEEAFSIRSSLPRPRRGSTLGMGRPEMTIYVALQAMQLFRLRDSHPAAAADTAAQQRNAHYEAALELLIRRYGAQAFMIAVRSVCVNHLDGLWKPNGQEMISELDPFHEPMADPAYVELARSALVTLYPLPETLNGYGHPAHVAALFGDVRFWNYLKSQQPAIFRGLGEWAAIPERRHPPAPSSALAQSA